MSDDRQPDAGIPTYVYDSANPVVRIGPLTAEEYRAFQERLAARPAPPSYAWDHDPTARVYRLTAPDGTIETFRDNPTRYLCVEPHPETGEMRPVMKQGRPVYLDLAREHR
jgi:hypothetical protein